MKNQEINKENLQKSMNQACELRKKIFNFEVKKGFFWHTTLEIKEKQLTLTSTLKENCMIDGEPTYLERLFSNLIDNAIKYSSKGGTITLSAMYNQNRLHFSIEDQGIGILSHHLSRIFDRFFQADNSRHGMGFGLGLSMCKRIMELHHGKINVKSKFGEGTTFDLDFPV